jgi:hypothetical protein
MKSTIGAIALIGGVMATAAAIALAGTTAFAGDDRVVEQRAQLAKLWGRDSAVTARQTATATMNVTGLDERRGDRLADRWAEEHDTFREHIQPER